MSKENWLIFCDFDGTVARRDVGYHMYHEFSGGRNDALLPDWKSGKLSTRDCLRKEAEMVTVESDQFFQFMDQFQLDDGFAEFQSRCEQAGLKLTIISDGLDIYIRYLFDKSGLKCPDLICNQGKLVDSHLEIVFPYDDPNDTGGGVCKGERIAEFRSRAEGSVKVLFVGDGLSDASAASEVDLLFAKKDLKVYCEEKKLSYVVWDDFFDVTKQMEALAIL
ncbi:MAG: MtnX-like HAD-IB family phosphatase [candidate division Zixibacteria bacterium]